MGEFCPLSRALGSIKGLGKVAAERAVMDKILAAWPDVAGGLSVDVDISFLRGAVLYLETHNPMWQMEFAFLKPMILDRVQKLVGSKTVSDVRLALVEAVPNRMSEADSGLDLPLESVIRLTNRNRQKAGMRICSGCGDVYTQDDICVFCRCQV